MEMSIFLFHGDIGSTIELGLSLRSVTDGMERNYQAPEVVGAAVDSVGLNSEGQTICDWDLPTHLLAKCFVQLISMKDMAATSMVSHTWRAGVKAALAQREKLGFVGFRMDDSSVARMVEEARNLQELDIHCNRWGSSITDAGLMRISTAKCCSKLKALSIFGLVEVTDRGVVQLVSNATSLEHLNVGGTYITDASLIPIGRSCTYLKTLRLWGCTNVTETGLLAVAEGCPYLVFLNTGCLRISKSFELHLMSFNSQLRLKPSHFVSLPGKPQPGSSSIIVPFGPASYHVRSFVS